MANPWKRELFTQQVSEIAERGNMRDIINLENFLLSSVAMVGGPAKIDPETKVELKSVADLLNTARARMDGVEDTSKVADHLKSRRAFIDPDTITLRGYLESEVFAHA